jgi:hypothetical protein
MSITRPSALMKRVLNASQRGQGWQTARVSGDAADAGKPKDRSKSSSSPGSKNAATRA